LTVFGVAVLIGAGIFTITARVAGDVAGPAVAASFVIAAIACGFAGLCYAEFASTVPVAGSAYTYSYATLGEFIAWIIGWHLILEYGLGAAVVSKSWSSYLSELFSQAGLPVASASVRLGALTFDWGAVLVITAITTVLMLGIQFTSRVTSAITLIKVLVVLLVLTVGFTYVNASNYDPFILPAGTPQEGSSGLDATLLSLIAGGHGSTFGIFSLLAGASLVFFAFIGFDAVSTTAEETRNPQRDLSRDPRLARRGHRPLRGRVVVLVGMVPYTALSTPAGTGESATLATAFNIVGANWASVAVSLGGLAGLTTVILVLMLGQSRVFFAMSRDGLLPRPLAATGARGVPVKTTAIVGAVCAMLAGFFPIEELEAMVNIGNLFAFVLVAVGTMVLRRTQPGLGRGFRAPALSVVAPLAVLSCVWLMLNLTGWTWIRFIAWMLAGGLVYACYGRRHSLLRRRAVEPIEVADSRDSGQ